MNTDASGQVMPDNFHLTDYGMFLDSALNTSRVKIKELICSMACPPKNAFDGTIRGLSSLQPKDMFLFFGASVTRHFGMCIVEVVELVYPIVDDAQTMGHIACSHLLNTLYSLQVTVCNSITLEVGLSKQMTESERNTTTTLLCSGFKEVIDSQNIQLLGVDFRDNPLCFIGGTASANIAFSKFKISIPFSKDNVVILTKPLGTMVAAFAHKWASNRSNQEVLMDWNIVTHDDILKAFNYAIHLMKKLNKDQIISLAKFNVKGITMVNQRGLLSSVQDLIYHQSANVDIVIHNIPIIAKTYIMDKLLDKKFSLLEGLSPEVSGGLLVCMSRESAEVFVKEQGQAWIIGIVQPGSRVAQIKENPYIIEVGCNL